MIVFEFLLGSLFSGFNPPSTVLKKRKEKKRKEKKRKGKERKGKERKGKEI
jgi:hypothetical protein